MARDIWHPPAYGKGDIRNIQAVAEGTATPEEMRQALNWIIETACNTYGEPFVPGHGEVRDYMLGRRSVGLAIVKLIKLKPEIFT